MIGERRRIRDYVMQSRSRRRDRLCENSEKQTWSNHFSMTCESLLTTYVTSLEFSHSLVRRRILARNQAPFRLLTRLCENSEMAFWKNEKRVLGPLAAKENAPYRNCGGRFSRVAGWRGVFAQSVTSAATTLQVRSLRKELPRYSTNRR